jgi:hypothetical protein
MGKEEKTLVYLLLETKIFNSFSRLIKTATNKRLLAKLTILYLAYIGTAHKQIS